MKKKVFSFYVWTYFSVLFLVFFILIFLTFLITFPFDRYRKAPNYVLSKLAKCMMAASPGWKIKLEDVDKAELDEPVIFIANHQSFLDMPLIYHLPWQMKWVSKRSLAFIPVMGWMVWLTGHLTINRNSKTALKKLDNLVQPLMDGVPVMIFPEGTRSKTGKLKTFKNGAFLLSIEYNIKIQPMVINGGYEAMSSGSKILKPNVRFTCKLLDPVYPDNFEDMSSLKEHCYHLMNKELQEIQA